MCVCVCNIYIYIYIIYIYTYINNIHKYIPVLTKDRRIYHTGKLCCQHIYDTNATVRTIAVLLEFGGRNVSTLRPIAVVCTSGTLLSQGVATENFETFHFK